MAEKSTSRGVYIYKIGFFYIKNHFHSRFLSAAWISYKERGEQGMEDDGGELLFELEGTERYLVHALAKAL